MKAKRTILLTGSAGFIGSNFIRKVISDKLPYRFVSIDAILASYNFHNLFEHPNHKFYMGDIADSKFVRNVFTLEKPDFVINMAAESFVGKSIENATEFIHSNILGAQAIIDASVEFGVKKLLQVSTDEVYGHLTSVKDAPWTEESYPCARNPYSASKLAAENLLYAANQTHGLKYNITRASNTYAGRQPPRNLVPRIIISLLHGDEIPIHGDGSNLREWLYVSDHISAIIKVLEEGVSDQTYNVGSGIEFTNLEMVAAISRIVGVEPKIRLIPDRKGHDLRYFLNCDKLKSIGWSPSFTFEQGMKETVDWYKANYEWYSKI